MDRLSLERKIHLAFAGGLALWAVVAFFSYRGTREMERAAAAVSHTYEVIGQLEALAYDLHEAESSQRGYVLTGDTLELSGYRAAVGSVAAVTDSLDLLLSADGRQAARLDALRPFVVRRLALLETAVAVYEAGGLEAAAQRMAQSPGRALMREVRGRIDEMEDAERALLLPRAELSRSVTRQTRAIVFVSGLLGVLFVVAGSAVIGRELRERRRAQAESARLASIVESSEDAIVGMTLDGTVTSWNRGAERIYGHAPADAVGRPVDALLPVDEASGGLRVLDVLERDDPREHGEAVHVARDGRRVQVSLMVSPVRNPEGALAGAAVIARDVTARRRAETRFGAVLDAATANAIIGTDEHGTITIFSRGAERMLGYHGDELIGRATPALFLDSEEVEARAAELGVEPGFEVLVHAARRGITETREWTYVRRDGGRLTVSLSVSALREAGETRGFIGIANDITERREVERMKEEFVSVVSHELRTPLTSIRGALGLLAGGKLGEVPEKARRMVEVAANNTDRLVRLINDILDIEKIQSGKVSLQREPLDLSRVGEEAVEEIRPVAERADVALDVRLPEAPLLADRDRMVQVFVNLLSNAIKFSPGGSTVHVGGELLDGAVEFWVRDEGRGIPEDKLEAIFGRFQQVDASDSRQKGGTGLGLAITRGLVEQHGGTVHAESEPGRGSTFRVRLPLGEAGMPAVSSPRTGSTGRLLLCCDDDPSFLEVLGEVLGSRGYDVVSTTAASEMLRLAASEQPDAILLDLMMPGMSGWEAMVALKAQPETSSIPVVVLSALGPGGEPAPEGAADWVVKTADQAELFRALDHSLATDVSLERVLVVEDDPDLARVLTETLASRGFEVAHAGSGREAIEKSQSFSPGLLVLDLLLPEGTGFDVVEWLRRHQRLRTTPVLVYTAHDLDEEQRKMLQLGDTRVFSKAQASPADVAQGVSEILRRVARPGAGDDA